MAYLTSQTDAIPWKIFELQQARTVLGRHPSCQVLLDNESVSRHHAQILESHGHFFLEDLKSRNGTLVNGKAIEQPTELCQNDAITLCDYVFLFQEQLPEELSSAIETLAIDEVTDSDSSRVFAVGVEPIDESPDTSSIVSKLSVISSGRDRMAADPEAKLQAILEISKSLGQVLELDAVLAHILDGLFEIFPQVKEGFVLLNDPESQQPVIKATRTRETDTKYPASVSLTIVREAMSGREAILSADVMGDNRFDTSQSIAGMKLRSMMCAPLLSQDGDPLGVLQLASHDITFPFTESDLDILVSIATQGSLAIENARLHEKVLRQRDLERELEFATQVQLGFLPNKRPEIVELEFFDYYEAAHRVGGDYFDYVPLPDGRVAVAVADVAGKGIPAALLMARLYSAARYHLLSDASLADALTGLNRDISISGLGHRFITCVLLIVDARQREVTMANAGHLPPLVKEQDGTISEWITEHTGMPLGIVPDQQFHQEVRTLEPGDTWLMFTDGITEAMNEQSEIFGSERLQSSLARGPHPLDQLVPSIVSDVEAHCGPRSQSDDMCLVAFRLIS